MNRSWMAPLTGVAFVVFMIAGFIIGGEPPDADSPVQDIVNWYADNDTSVGVAAALIGIGGIFLVFFGNHLRRVYAAAPRGSGSAVAPVALVGTAIVAIGFAIDATILIALASAADDIAPASTQALQALWDNDFLPIALGIELFLISNAIAVLSTGVLPRWLGWIAILFVILGVTPIGFVSFIGTGLWILVVAIILTRRERSVAAPPPPAPATAP